ncbi:MAG: hypothetical protein ACJAWL_001083 [Motiliproteus sp.]|jgi:hypothetical protein
MNTHTGPKMNTIAGFTRITVHHPGIWLSITTSLNVIFANLPLTGIIRGSQLWKIAPRDVDDMPEWMLFC